MNWYAVNTKPHQEYLAELMLQRLGVETFCPQLKHSKLIGQKRQTVTDPLFPGYIFVRFNLDTQYRAVNYAQGVRNVVAFGHHPAIVNDGLIESIKSKLEDGYVTVERPSFTSGQAVRIQEGPFRGFNAVFVHEMSDQQRVVLLLQALSYQARVIVDLEHVVTR
jgi:transcriptional antiterminator RfaH